MATYISAEDFVAICLHLAKGDSQKSVKEIIDLVNEYQQKMDGFFGVCDGDFWLAFQMLFFPFRKTETDIDRITEESTFHECMVIILRNFFEAHFNDTDTYWSTPYALRVNFSNNSLIMQHFFENKENHDPEKIILFLNSIGKGCDIIDYYLHTKGSAPCDMDNHAPWLTRIW